MDRGWKGERKGEEGGAMVRMRVVAYVGGRSGEM
jgi:hypothetical protein